MSLAQLSPSLSFLVSLIIPRNFDTHLASCVVAGHRSVCSFWSAVIESKWGNKAVTGSRKHCLLRLNVGQTKIVQVHRLLYISPVNQYKWGKHSVLVCLIFTHLIWKWHKKALTWIFLLIVGTQTEYSVHSLDLKTWNWVSASFQGTQKRLVTPFLRTENFVFAPLLGFQIYS